jgi:hypothetical protein
MFTSPDIIRVVKGVGRLGQVEGKCSEIFGLETSVEKLKSLDNTEMDFTGLCFKNS